MTHLYRLKRICLAAGLLVVAVFSALPLHAQRGALVQPRNLSELVGQSSLIVRGSIVSARSELDPELTNLWTVVVTVHVVETLKGSAQETYTFRQFIWDIRDRYDHAGYTKGQQVLLLMNPTTRYGFTSPAGILQGRFRIMRDATGREVAVNGYGNAGLFRNLPEQLKSKRLTLGPHLATVVSDNRARPIPLDDLRELTRQFSAMNNR
jgi:hypothetical protein